MEFGATVHEGLVGRAEELALVGQALDAARAGMGVTVVVEGAAGIGKTTLLAAVRRQAEAAGMLALTGRGSALEHEFAMGVVRQCLEPTVRGRDELLTGAAERARSVVAAVPEGRPGTPEEVLHGLYWLTANLAVEAPLLLVSATRTGRTRARCGTRRTSRSAGSPCPSRCSWRCAAVRANRPSCAPSATPRRRVS